MIDIGEPKQNGMNQISILNPSEDSQFDNSRSLENFKINQPQDRMPPAVVRAFGILKGAAAKVNMRFGLGNMRRLRSISCGKLRACSRPEDWECHRTSSRGGRLFEAR